MQNKSSKNGLTTFLLGDISEAPSTKSILCKDQGPKSYLDLLNGQPCRHCGFDFGEKQPPSKSSVTAINDGVDGDSVKRKKMARWYSLSLPEEYLETSWGDEPLHLGRILTCLAGVICRSLRHWQLQNHEIALTRWFHLQGSTVAIWAGSIW